MSPRFGRRDLEALAAVYCTTCGYPFRCTVFREYARDGRYMWHLAPQINGVTNYRHRSALGETIDDARRELERRIEACKERET